MNDEVNDNIWKDNFHGSIYVNNNKGALKLLYEELWPLWTHLNPILEDQQYLGIYNRLN